MLFCVTVPSNLCFRMASANRAAGLIPRLALIALPQPPQVKRSEF